MRAHPENALGSLAPIVLFVYNRPWHTRQTVEALLKNESADQSPLFIFSDGPKDEEAKQQVNETRAYLKGIGGFASMEIISRKNNLGLADSIISGVTEVLKTYGKVIVLEDDMITSPFFLRFMNKALQSYLHADEIFSISAYNHPPGLMKIPDDYRFDAYLTCRNSSWGWGIWKDRWDKVDWEVIDFPQFQNDIKRQDRFNQAGDDLTDMLFSQMQGRIDSWAIRLTYTLFKHNALSLWPVYSYINNIGCDESGVHSKRTLKYENNLGFAKKDVVFPEGLSPDPRILKSFRKVYRRGPLTRIKKFFSRGSLP